jgi:hypothetical protein
MQERFGTQMAAVGVPMRNLQERIGHERRPHDRAPTPTTPRAAAKPSELSPRSTKTVVAILSQSEPISRHPRTPEGPETLPMRAEEHPTAAFDSRIPLSDPPRKHGADRVSGPAWYQFLVPIPRCVCGPLSPAIVLHTPRGCIARRRPSPVRAIHGALLPEAVDRYATTPSARRDGYRSAMCAAAISSRLRTSFRRPGSGRRGISRRRGAPPQ